MKTVQQIMEETGAKANIENFRYMQEHYTYKQKIRHAENVARSYEEKCREMGMNCHVSVGGLDSITLHYFLEECGVHVPCVSCSTLEQKGVQAVHKRIAAEMEVVYPAREWYAGHNALTQEEINCIEDADEMEREQAALDACPTLPRMYFLKPMKPKAEVIQELGFPVLSKEIAGKISLLQNPTPKNATVRHAVITGETGEYGGFQKNSRMKLSQRWLEKFGGADEEGAQLGYEAAPFKVSDRCCYYLKEKPCEDWAKANNSVPYLGLMASEGGRREKSLMMHGCNYFGKNTIRSAPFAIFSRQDILQLAIDLDVPVPEEYGKIVRDADGTLRTTLAQRTGCTMCGFGIHMEKRPNRFDRLRESNPKEWEFWMRHVCHDEDGNWYGWGRVLDYIGVEWENEPGQLAGQLAFE
ncbi:MAG: hypothetical protein SO256_01875 [Gemmiger sp.]|uniref:hypothetical protein n=1 Tax=Gemmiger sp. TaxID=2049027 RepID=UPI002A7FDD94|nr:hypothetical protein [Gemmiger sp.]MDY4772477.1 hypothetical protein [Gemmiger sp.]